ncbi:MAG: hypothetical protein ABI877_09295 [Gemmatimonadaceae bacterium]
MRVFSTVLLSVAFASVPAFPVVAQSATTAHKHTPGMSHDSATAAATSPPVGPTSPGQAAYGAIAEIARLLEADPTTDWSKVDLETVRQHLIDMDDVTMHALVESERVDGGLSMQVTGAGRTGDAVRRMLTPHVLQLDAAPLYHATVAAIPNGMQLTVVARRSGDQATVAKIRGLGFIGLLAYGDHHPQHHIALARGEVIAGHSH